MPHNFAITGAAIIGLLEGIQNAAGHADLDAESFALGWARRARNSGVDLTAFGRAIQLLFASHERSAPNMALAVSQLSR